MTPDDLKRLYEDFQDDEIFARESLSINNKAGQTVPLLFGPAQAKLAKIIERQRELGKPVRVIALKARQVWISTYVAARFWRDTAHQSGQHTLILANSDETAANVYGYYDTFDKTYTPFRGIVGKPERSNDSTESLEYTNGSYIKFHTAKTATIGRSRSLRRVHFSEFAFYPDTARQLMGAVMSSVPSDPDTEVIIESTANGIGNEFHHLWQRAMSGASEWIPFFFGWWEHPEYVLDIENPGAFESSLTDYERDIRQQYNLTNRQLAWRRWKIANELSGDEELFKQEFPGNPEEAFLTSGRPRFDHKALARMPLMRDCMEGGLELLELGGGHKKLTFVNRQRGELVIFRPPQPHREYVIGGDVAEGIDVDAVGGKSSGTPNPDYCVAQVVDRDSGEQVARMRARFTPGEFGRQLYMLGAYYHWAQIVVEANGPGLACIDSLCAEQLSGTPGYPKNLLYHRIEQTDQDPNLRSDRVGYKTTPVTRPQLINLIDEATRTLAYTIHDPITLSEFMTFVIKANGRAEHQTRCHDDCVISSGLGLIGIQQMPRREPPKLLPTAQTQIDNYLRGDYDREDSTERRRRF